MSSRHSPVQILAAALTLSGCGGGSGGGAMVANNLAPNAAFTANPISGGAPLLVNFDASSSSDADGNIASFDWNFGDGTAAGSGAVVSHSFAATSAGARYNVRLIVRDDRGASATKDAEIRVGPPGGNFTLSGTIQILPSSTIDSDVNDTGTTADPNNDFGAAQSIANPVTLGGYLTRPGRGKVGNLRATGDVADFFSVSLSGNETLLLSVGEPEPDVAADDPTLSMQLYDDARNLVDSVVLTESGSLVAPAGASASYFIEVAISEGATNYVLNLGQTVPTNAASAPRLSDAFVPGELIIRAPTTAVLPDDVTALAGETELRLVSVAKRMPERRALNRLTGPRVGGRLTARAADKYETIAAAVRLGKTRGVIRATPNYLRRAHRVPNDPFYRYQWHYPNINLPLAWDITQGATQGASQVIVAVIDTGILPNHPDIAGQLVAGYDFIRSPSTARDGNGIDADPSDTGDLAYGSSSSFHGTHVAGTVAAQSDDGEGVAGVAWTTNTRIMPLRALGVDGGTSYDVMQAIRFAARSSNDSGTLPPQRADVINMSLGGGDPSVEEEQLMVSVRAAGVVIVASAGNEFTSLPSYPAAYDGVVSVAATTIDKLRASYSNFGSTIDVAAPGGNNGTDRNGDGLADGVVSTIGDDSGAGIAFGYAALNGTSMSAPHIAGVVALMKAVFPGLDPNDFDTALQQGLLTEDLGNPGRDNDFGWGLIDAQKAVIAALDLANSGGAPTDPILVGSPSSVNFGPIDTAIDVVVRNAGGGALTITATSTTDAWLTVAPVSVDANGLGTYRLLVDRSQVAGDGTYSSEARFDSDVPNGNPFIVSAVMQRFTVNPQADAGLHYIVVYHPATGTTVNGVSRLPSSGVYNFSIPNIGAGTYQIYAGTDNDNDNTLCDGGEACGAFRLLESPDVITVTAGQSGLDFVSGFRASLFDPAAAAASSQPAAGVPIPIQRSRIEAAP